MFQFIKRIMKLLTHRGHVIQEQDIIYTHDGWVFGCGECVDFVAKQGRTRNANLFLWFSCSNAAIRQRRRAMCPEYSFVMGIPNRERYAYRHGASAIGRLHLSHRIRTPGGPESAGSAIGP